MNGELSNKERRAYYILIALCILVYLTGWAIPLMEIDAAQYANMSREMFLHKSFLQVYDQGHDYLDKPPMNFWLGSLSMYFFGISAAAYRLPSFLFSILSIYSTYRLARLYYAERIALLSALVLASCQAMFLINHDVRTDTMLMGWVTLSLWQLAAWFKTNKWKYLLLASVAIAGGMLTKGPLALMIPAFAFIPHIILRRSFKDFFRWEYLLMIVIIGILLAPMTWGLYQQFDLHPEKTVNGQTHVSGVKFFYWTQSFGRITGDRADRENDSFFFLFQNMLWSFLPWILFFLAGLVSDLRQIIQKRFLLNNREEWITTGGFIITYCALGSSRAQLPHYIFVVFPLAAIITGKFLYTLIYTDALLKLKKIFFATHAVIFSLLGVALFMLLYFPFPPVNWLLISVYVVLLVTVLVMVLKKLLPLPAIVTLLVPAVISINLLMNTGFYRPLLQYQVSIKVNDLIAKEHYNKDRFFQYKINAGWSFDFYGNHLFEHINNVDTLRSNDYVLTSKEGLDSLDKTQFKILYTGQGFHVTKLTLPFLNPANRDKETDPYYILQRN